jgi:hypothetical protein
MTTGHYTVDWQTTAAISERCCSLCTMSPATVRVAAVAEPVCTWRAACSCTEFKSALHAADCVYGTVLDKIWNTSQIHIEQHTVGYLPHAWPICSVQCATSVARGACPDFDTWESSALISRHAVCSDMKTATLCVRCANLGHACC